MTAEQATQLIAAMRSIAVALWFMLMLMAWRTGAGK